MPIPPEQHRAWRPPALDDATRALTIALFEAGFPDPRGCSYVAARVPGLISGSEEQHGWLFERGGTRWLITHRGTIARVEALLGSANFEHDAAASEAHHDGPLAPTTLPLLVRLGRVQEAARIALRWHRASALDPAEEPSVGPLTVADEAGSLVETWLANRYDRALVSLVGGRGREAEARLDALEASMTQLSGWVPEDAIIRTSLPKHIARARRANRTPLAAKTTLVGMLQRASRIYRRHPGVVDTHPSTENVVAMLKLALDDDGPLTRMVAETGGLAHNHLVEVSEVAVSVAFFELEARGVSGEVEGIDVLNEMNDPDKRRATALALRRAFDERGRPADRLASASHIINAADASTEDLRDAAAAILQSPAQRQRPIQSRALALRAAIKNKLDATTADALTQCLLARALIHWSPADHAAAIEALDRAQRVANSDADAAQCAGTLTVHLARLGVSNATQMWADAVARDFATVPQWVTVGSSHALMDWLSPLWARPLDPHVQRAAKMLFGQSGPWLPRADIVGGDGLLDDLLSKRQLYVHAAFRSHVLDMLADDTIIGTLRTSARQYDIQVRDMKYGTDIYGAEFPSTAREHAMRLKDVVGYLLTGPDGTMPYRAYWPESQRNRGLDIIAQRIRDNDWP